MTAPPAETAPRASRLLGSDRSTRRHLQGVLISAATYVLYSAILLAQVASGHLDAAAVGTLVAAALLTNLAFYAAVRSGRCNGGRDPGLAATQMVVGILFLYATYAVQGPTAPGTTIVMASHVVYAMFWMPPKRLWAMVAAALAGLAATMAVSSALWPARHPVAMQLVAFAYAALVLPTIALLAGRVAAMTARLRSQHRELQDALATMRQMAMRDELTRTHNRAAIAELAQRQHEQHRRRGAPLSLALIDLDHFKSVNDRHGHAAGDEVLRRFAGRAREKLRTVDQVGRWGGEEFLVVLPDAERDQALDTIERLQRHFADTGVMPHGLTLSFSAGVTEWQPDEPIDSAIERADRAMYRAKEGGRARCVAA